MASARFCYVVLCHTDAPAVVRLVQRIQELSADAAILVRYEAGAFPDDAERAALAALGVPTLVSSIHVRWGEWSMVQMVLESMRVARRNVAADHYVFISGQDYPVADLAAWERRLAGRGVDALLAPMTDQPRDHRFTWWVSGPPPWLPRAALSTCERILGHLGRRTRGVVEVYPRRDAQETRFWLGLPRLRTTSPVPVVKSAQWCTLSARAVDAVVTLDSQNPAFAAFFRTVRTPDEYYIGSLVRACPALRVEPGHTSATRFDPGSSRPRWLDAALVREQACAGAAPFARKVPPGVDPGVIAEADRWSGARRPIPADDGAGRPVPAATS